MPFGVVVLVLLITIKYKEGEALCFLFVEHAIISYNNHDRAYNNHDRPRGKVRQGIPLSVIMIVREERCAKAYHLTLSVEVGLLIDRLDL